MSTPTGSLGFSLRMFIPDGDPDGLKLVEKSNWSGCGLVIPRSIFPEARKRPELDGTGVYVLAGEDEQSPLPLAYVGEGAPIRPRLEQHVKYKDFWTTAVVFTSKDQNLNKAHVQQLEARLVGLARQSNRCVLENSTTPQPIRLADADMADVESFLKDVLLCLPILGFNFFEPAPRSTPTTAELTIRAKDARARGFESSKGFVVRAGSTAAKEESSYIPNHLSNLRAELVRQGVLVDRGSGLEFTQDYPFASPSAAAGVIWGRAANGRLDWKTRDGKSLKDLQEQESESAE